jgi:hypothetical protein
LLVGVCLLFAILVPEQPLRAINTGWLRFALFLVCFLLGSGIMLHLYGLFYDPPPARLTRYALYYVMGLGMTASISPVGLLGVQRVHVLDVEITAQEAGLTSVLSLAVTFTAIFLLVKHYTYCLQPQAPPPFSPPSAPSTPGSDGKHKPEITGTGGGGGTINPAADTSS